ncbi:hypothetical protein SDRG_06189 [Saprolegnia diclina VS20]|uniref:Uncharacterized protein n=1 Tax=Saprolegnia diclina (strain VS20) TaxID=1156394 RepID=T0QFM7_SAPDV|nr:hypothetical protein SDRG_06189 [Saprolegnia diclina VS20]EQC36754.1 hypothetical protein SDRG_06189 [Saprolegnia diclina VS20]|eukprot:XP_008610175.1 hypothetical protein SDRG_06189 [Saprolegnia diclina VS20]
MNVSWYRHESFAWARNKSLRVRPSGVALAIGPVVPEAPRGRRRLSYLASLVIWITLSANSLLDPIKTLYGYYLYTESNHRESVWALVVTNTFNNISSKVCSPNGPFLDCYFELPVYGTGSLAGATCRSYYPIDKSDTQHIGSFFGNCTLPSGERIDMPSDLFATTQWSLQTASTDRSCLATLGEGDAFPCDSYTTGSGRVINYRVSKTATTKWCKEFGGYFLLNHHTGIQEVLVANVSNASTPVFSSLRLDYATPVFSLEDLLGCAGDLYVGATAGHTTTTAWYGDTVGAWTARTSSAAKSMVMTRNVDGTYIYSALSWFEGAVTQIGPIYRDLFRCSLLLLVTVYRISSIYYPIWLVYKRQGRTFWAWAAARHMGLVLHKRERRSLPILTILSLEALLSTDDIVSNCQHAIYTVPSSYFSIVLTYMSITRIIWPCAFFLLLFSRLIEWTIGPHFAFALSEDLFLLGAPVVWIYLPAYVTTQGMKLFHGYRWNGVIVRHYVSSIRNVYSNQVNNLALYTQLFGYFTAISSATTIGVGCLWQAVTHTSSIMSYLLSPHRSAWRHTPRECKTIEDVLIASSERLPPEIAYQITKAKWPQTQQCEAMNLASEGLVSLVYGPWHVVGFTEWGFVFPLTNAKGHAAVIDGCTVQFRPDVTHETLASLTATPARLGIPDLM